jgi:glycosyltransferase involved in cell wall biosynthesis
MARALVAAGIPCEVVTTRFMSGLPRVRDEGGVRVHRLATKRGRLSRPVEFGRAFLFFVRHGGRFAIVHGDCLSAFTLGAVLGGRLRCARAILGTCTAEPGGDISRVLGAPGGRLLWRLICTADALTAWVPAVADGLRTHGAPRSRVVQLVHLVPVGAGPLPDAASRPQARSALGLPDRLTVLYVGRLSEAKGVDVLLDAWATIRARSSATLVLIGDGPLADRAKDVSLSDAAIHVVVAGTQTDVEAWLSAADLFVFPSRSETFGTALAEAMGSGLAIVATPTGLVQDGFEDGIHGRVVPIGDPGRLGEVIDELLADHAARASLGAAARAFVAERYSPERALDAHLALYRRLTSDSLS